MPEVSTQRRSSWYIGTIAVLSALLGLTLLVFQNISAICGATGLLCVRDGAQQIRQQKSPAGWKILAKVADYSTNWERTSKRTNEIFPQIITRFDLPMTADRRIGAEVSVGEYIEMFRFEPTPNYLTMQIRMDRGEYWLLSRQTFDLADHPALAGRNPNDVSNDEQLYIREFQNDIDATRYLLRTFSN